MRYGPAPAAEGDKNTLDEDMAAFGISSDIQEQVAADLAARTEPLPENFTVEPDNWPAVLVFLKFETQWRYGQGGITGIDYTPLIQYLRTKFRKDWELILDQVQRIEHGALVAFYKLKRKADGP